MSIFLFSPLFAAYLLALAFLVGACMGSFVNCVQMRLSERSGSIFGRSRCPKCGHTLGILDLFPVLSYAFLRGKCRYCKAPVDFNYLAVELIFGAGYVGIFAMFGLSWLTLEYLLLFTLLAASSLSDLRTLEVPDSLHIASIVVFAAFIMTHADPLHRLIDGLIGFAVYGAGMLVLSLVADKVYKKDTLGGADIKMLAVLGLFFGPVKMLLLLILSCLLGLAGAALAKAGLGKEFPFIPAITLGAYITALFADPIIEWYLGLFSLALHSH